VSRLVLVGLSVVFGEWLSARYKLLSFALIVYVFLRLSEWRNSWASCHHGWLAARAGTGMRNAFKEIAADEFYGRESELLS
jgi:hypothetical protein